MKEGFSRSDLQKLVMNIAEAASKASGIGVHELLPSYCPSHPAIPAVSYAPDQLLDTKHAAAFLGLAAKTLENWRTAGKGPQHKKVGGRCFYRVKDLSRYLRSKTRSSTSEV